MCKIINVYKKCCAINKKTNVTSFLTSPVYSLSVCRCVIGVNTCVTLKNIWTLVRVRSGCSSAAPNV